VQAVIDQAMHSMRIEDAEAAREVAKSAQCGSADFRTPMLGELSTTAFRPDARFRFECDLGDQVLELERVVSQQRAFESLFDRSTGGRNRNVVTDRR